MRYFQQTHSKNATSGEFVSYSGKQSILKFLPHFLIFSFFWMLTCQIGSTWIFQANLMKGKMLPEQASIFNSIYGMLLIYPVSIGLQTLKKTLLFKMVLGLSFSGLSFIVAGALQKYHVHANIAWMLPQFLCMTLGEVSVDSFFYGHGKITLFFSDFARGLNYAVHHNPI
jgi:dipeptide/tripeptide permease